MAKRARVGLKTASRRLKQLYTILLRLGGVRAHTNCQLIKAPVAPNSISYEFTGAFTRNLPNAYCAAGTN